MGLKVILAIGGVIIFLLLLSNMLDGFLRSSLEEEQTNAITVNSETMKLNSLQKENQYLQANYRLSEKVKKSRQEILFPAL